GTHDVEAAVAQRERGVAGDALDPGTVQYVDADLGRAEQLRWLSFLALLPRTALGAVARAGPRGLGQRAVAVYGVEQLRRLGRVGLDPVVVVRVRDHRDPDEVDVLPRDSADAPGDLDDSVRGQTCVGGERVRLADVVDDRPCLGEAVQDVGLEYLLHQTDHQQLVALGPLQV